MIHELVRERRESQQPGKPVIHELVRERRFRPVFEAGNQSKFSKTCIPAADYPRHAISSWFVVVQMSWFTVVVQMSWFNVMVNTVMVRGGSWWFVVVRGGFSPQENIM